MIAVKFASVIFLGVAKHIWGDRSCPGSDRGYVPDDEGVRCIFTSSESAEQILREFMILRTKFVILCQPESMRSFIMTHQRMKSHLVPLEFLGSSPRVSRHNK